MMYLVPVIFNVVGWTEIEADSLDEARMIANAINQGERELPIGDIHESDSSIECMVDEVELVVNPYEGVA